MTRTTGNTVKLSKQDWFGLMGIFITLIVLMASAFLRHDRLIIEVITRQQVNSDRIERIEMQLDLQVLRSD